MKKFSTSKLVVLMLVLTLVTSCLVGGTFAKYTAEISTSDTARVAKFAVTAFGTDATENATATVNLFEVAKVYDLKDVTDFSVSGTADADIKTATDGTPIIAPGCWGEFSYDVANTSEVTVTYAVDYTVNEAGVPLQWSVDGTNWTDDLADLAAANLAMETGADSNRVLWKWEFDGNDTTDTALGVAGTATPSVQIDVTFTQVD